MKIGCPHCGVQGSIDDSLAGRKLRCPKCSKVFLVTDDMRPGSDDFAAPPEEHTAESTLQPPPDEVIAEEVAESEEESLDEQEAVEGKTEGEREFADEGHVPVEDLLGPDDASKEDFLDELDKKESCTNCGELFHPEFLETVGDQRFCTLCLSEEENEEDDEEFLEEDLGDDAVLKEKCSVCGESFHPDFLQEVDNKYFCGVCQPNVIEEATIEESEEPDEEEVSATPMAIAEPVEPETAVVEVDEEEPEEGGSDFSVGELLKEAWQKTKGAKGAIWGGLIVMYAILCGLGFAALYSLQDMGPDSDPSMLIGANGGMQLVSTLLSTLFTAGIMLIGVRRAKEQRVSWSMVFAGFAKFLSITVALILQSIMILIGFLLLILPGIYLSVGYGLTFPLILEKGLGPWQAMEASRKAIHTKWWTVFGLYLVMMLLLMVSSIPMGLGLIWTLPMFFVLIGVLYVRFYGMDDDGGEDAEAVEEEEDVEENGEEEGEQSE